MALHEIENHSNRGRQLEGTGDGDVQLQCMTLSKPVYFPVARIDSEVVPEPLDFDFGGKAHSRTGGLSIEGADNGGKDTSQTALPGLSELIKSWLDPPLPPDGRVFDRDMSIAGGSNRVRHGSMHGSTKTFISLRKREDTAFTDTYAPVQREDILRSLWINPSPADLTDGARGRLSRRRTVRARSRTAAAGRRGHRARRRGPPGRQSSGRRRSRSIPARRSTRRNGAGSLPRAVATTSASSATISDATELGPAPSARFSDSRCPPRVCRFCDLPPMRPAAPAQLSDDFPAAVVSVGVGCVS